MPMSYVSALEKILGKRDEAKLRTAHKIPKVMNEDQIIKEISHGNVALFEQETERLRRLLTEHEVEVGNRNVEIETLKALLRETEHMHLRTEENRPWLNRRNVALGWPPQK